jgi:hypothetical protein
MADQTRQGEPLTDALSIRFTTTRGFASSAFRAAGHDGISERL